MIRHIKRWNEWRKCNLNSKWHKSLVLLGLRRSSSFEFFIPNKKIKEAFEKGINGINKETAEAYKKLWEENIKEVLECPNPTSKIE